MEIVNVEVSIGIKRKYGRLDEEELLEVIQVYDNENKRLTAGIKAIKKTITALNNGEHITFKEDK